MSAKDALLKYHAKHAAGVKRTQSRAGKKNGKPEKVLEKQVLTWASNHAIHLHVVESKAVYSASAGRYLRGQAEAGLPDLIGNIEGLSAWIELKAKGRRGTLKEHQREFLVRKIEQGCFAVCIDSVDQLASVLAAFLSTPSSDRVRLLLDHLPIKRHRHPNNPDEKLF
jgi:hypothetical protein